MSPPKSYFFCGVGGSGMLPLALIAQARGAQVEGSDRSLDQGRTPEKFDFLRARGVRLHPQDGSGVTRADQVVIASAAVEDTVPDIAAANQIGAQRITRAELLAEMFNAAPLSVGVAGTSGKSTVTGMIGWILHHAGRDPTIMNGAVMKPFVTAEAPFASAVVGAGEVFVSEVDESDGSIALYRPTIAVVNNVSLDHKPIEELRGLFADFVERSRTAVLNLDNPDTAELARRMPAAVTYAMEAEGAGFTASKVRPEPAGVQFQVRERDSGETAEVRLPMPGLHNVANALAALAAARAAGVGLADASRALARFTGIRRRLERVGEAGGVTVIDDFAHNPDKIAATLSALRAFPGRLLVLFQPHGYGPLKLMREPLVEAFANHLSPEDRLLITEPVYFGGTVDRSVGAEAVVAGVAAAGRRAEAFLDRASAGSRLLEAARPGDRVVVMGARDDTLSLFAGELLEKLGG